MRFCTTSNPTLPSFKLQHRFIAHSTFVFIHRSLLLPLCPSLHSLGQTNFYISDLTVNSFRATFGSHVTPLYQFLQKGTRHDTHIPQRRKRFHHLCRTDARHHAHVLCCCCGWAAVRDALVNELNDVSHAIGAVSQSYSVTGFKKEKLIGKPHAQCSGFGFNDDADECDCKIIEYVDVCGKNDPSTGDRE